MSKDVTGNPLVFDTAAEAEGAATSGSVFDVPIYVDHVVFRNVTGATNTTFELLTKAAGDTVTGAWTVAAGAEKQVEIRKYVTGIYVESLPTSGKIYVFHGEL